VGGDRAGRSLDRWRVSGLEGNYPPFEVSVIDAPGKVGELVLVTGGHSIASTEDLIDG
jgi:hypothetical protein